MKVWVVEIIDMEGSGSGVNSVHRTWEGAEEAARRIHTNMKSDRPFRWSFPNNAENQVLFLTDRHHVGCRYMEVVV